MKSEASLIVSKKFNLLFLMVIIFIAVMSSVIVSIRIDRNYLDEAIVVKKELLLDAAIFDELIDYKQTEKEGYILFAKIPKVYRSAVKSGDSFQCSFVDDRNLLYIRKFNIDNIYDTLDSESFAVEAFLGVKPDFPMTSKIFKTNIILTINRSSLLYEFFGIEITPLSDLIDDLRGIKTL